MFFSGVGIIFGIVGLVFYHPYLWLTDKIFYLRARRAPEVSDRYTYLRKHSIASTRTTGCMKTEHPINSGFACGLIDLLR